MAWVGVGEEGTEIIYCTHYNILKKSKKKFT